MTLQLDISVNIFVTLTCVVWNIYLVPLATSPTIIIILFRAGLVCNTSVYSYD